MRDYSEYLDKWLMGIESEVKFWDKLIGSKGACVNGEEIFNLRTSFEAPFMLEEEVEKPETDFLDIGSGPYSNCGIKTSKTQLNFMAIDPLAAAYKTIKEKYGVVTPVNPEVGMIEVADIMFGENSFDMVHMSNSLDHSFDPVCGIAKLIYITRLNGKIIFRHCENEAEHEKYIGLHQWNIHCEDGKMIIWRPGYSFDIEKEFGEYIKLEKAEIRTTVELNSKWTHNYFVLRKIKEIPKAEDKNLPILMKKLMSSFCMQYIDNLNKVY